MEFIKLQNLKDNFCTKIPLTSRTNMISVIALLDIVMSYKNGHNICHTNMDKTSVIQKMDKYNMSYQNGQI